MRPHRNGRQSASPASGLRLAMSRHQEPSVTVSRAGRSGRGPPSALGAGSLRWTTTVSKGSGQSRGEHRRERCGGRRWPLPRRAVRDVAASSDAAGRPRALVFAAAGRWPPPGALRRRRMDGTRLAVAAKSERAARALPPGLDGVVSAASTRSVLAVGRRGCSGVEESRREPRIWRPPRGAGPRATALGSNVSGGAAPRGRLAP